MRYACNILCLLCLLATLGCTKRNHYVTESSIMHGNPSAHPIAAANHVTEQIGGELRALRVVSLGGVFLGILGGIVLRSLIPGLSTIGFSVAGASLGMYILGLVFGVAAPWLVWVAGAVLILGVLWGIYHLYKWEKTP